jgi:hypothetical protein
VNVLGDSTGNERGEWVDLWARHLGETATVEFHQWGEDTEAYPAEPYTYGDGARRVTIWNGSKHGSQGQYARDRIRAMQPVAPDLIIYNYGHNKSTDGVVADIEALNQSAQARWRANVPFVVMLQNPAQGTREGSSAAAVEAIRAWAKPRGVAVIDVPTAFAANGGASVLLADEVHPNASGSKVWADAVAKALG